MITRYLDNVFYEEADKKNNKPQIYNSFSQFLQSFSKFNQVHCSSIASFFKFVVSGSYSFPGCGALGTSSINHQLASSIRLHKVDSRLKVRECLINIAILLGVRPARTVKMSAERKKTGICFYCL